MIYESGHPHTALSDWETFRRQFPRRLIEDVIERSEFDLPDWFTPLARGGAIASDLLLRRAGYRPGSRRPPGWKRAHCDVFERDMRSEKLLVREYRNQGLWTIERWKPERLYNIADEALVFLFGSTPIFARNYQAAMYIGEWCHIDGLPPGLGWINACPTDREGAIAFAKQRRIDEALARQNRHPPVQQHQSTGSQSLVAAPPAAPVCLTVTR